jgi:cytochrome P450
LRLHPVFLVIGRRLCEPTTVAGFDLPAGVIVAPCLYLIHRRADVWSDPLRFDPERFLRARPTPWEFLPFGGGTRRCLGMSFALHEMKVVAARVLMRTELRLLDSAVRPVRRGVTCAPGEGVPVVVDARRGGRRVECWTGQVLSTMSASAPAP